MSTEQEKHKSGPLKQKNKAHKFGRHRTKGLIDNANRGKVDVKTASKKKSSLDRQQRRHQSKQIRKHKREEVMTQKRKLGTDLAPPHVVALFLLSNLCNVDEVLEHIKSSDDTIEFHKKESSLTVISKRHRQRFTILHPDRNNLFAILDSAKVADSFLFILPASGELDGLSESCLSCLISQGLPPSLHAVQGLKHVPIKKQSDVRKTLNKKLEKWFPEIKLHSIDNSQDGGVILRQIANQKQKRIHYRENRPYLLTDKTEFQPDSQEENSLGTLKVSGYLRGKGLSVNGLLHLPGLGDFQMKQIDLPTDPYKIQKMNKKKTDSEDMEEDIKVHSIADPSNQETLQTEAEVDPMDGEQTWPTDQELIEADEAAKQDINKEEKKVPKGTSEYQASWILNEDDEEGDSDDDDSDDDSEDDDEMEAYDDDEEEENAAAEEYDTISIAPSTVVNDERYDEQFDMDEEHKALEKYQLERENDMFPDEVDTPRDIPARDRFIKYRGLKSFRTSPWDTKENLPLDYARIFQFQNFNRTKKKILKAEENKDAAQAGWYITIHVEKVPQAYANNLKAEQPLVVFGLLPFEQKMTVMNYVIKRHPSNDVPIKANDRLIFHVGYRRFSSCPIFSSHTTGDKFKGERFLKHGMTTVATVYAPIMFSPSPVLVFTEDHQFVATGTVLNSNPNRIVVKKIVLSGHPFKINKKSSVVRYMFFGRDDILWFKPVEVYTKYGRRGNIKEPLGTRGHMKCIFDGPLKAQDTVCMNLYKRLFPKWTYDANIAIPTNITSEIHVEKSLVHDVDM